MPNRFKVKEQTQKSREHALNGYKNQGMRIDYIFITEPLLKSLRDVFVDTWARKKRQPKPSDHAPVVGVFEL